MTVEEKRKKLDKHCGTRLCCDCELTGRNICLCGNNHSFMRTPDEREYMTDAEIIGAYQIVFGEYRRTSEKSSNK